MTEIKQDFLLNSLIFEAVVESICGLRTKNLIGISIEV